MRIIAWLCPHRFPAWREVYRRTATAADVLVIRLQAGNPLGLTLDTIQDGDPLFAGKQVVAFETDVRWTSSNWRQQLCDFTRTNLNPTAGTIIQQFDEDELLSREEIAADLKLITSGLVTSVWHRFAAPLPTADRFFDGKVPAGLTYPGAPHCKIWTWHDGASFTNPRYHGYASPCGYPEQPHGREHVSSLSRIRHLLFATPALRAGRREALTKYLSRANRLDLLDAAPDGASAPIPEWITSLVGV